VTQSSASRKPFAVAELIARAHSVLRRLNRPAQDEFVFEDLQVNRVSHEVRRAGRAIELNPEYALLEFLLRHPGRSVPRNTIIEEVWRMQGDALTKSSTSTSVGKSTLVRIIHSSAPSAV
jgi:DNA-binding response OmpR family regulator